MRHSPCGECGLKLHCSVCAPNNPGHSPCGECGLKYVWAMAHGYRDESLPMRGVWIEMHLVEHNLHIGNRHSPCGECGLKLLPQMSYQPSFQSLPMRGVWIEIPPNIIWHAPFKSLPMRGVWIEISGAVARRYCRYVTPHAGSVD